MTYERGEATPCKPYRDKLGKWFSSMQTIHLKAHETSVDFVCDRCGKFLTAHPCKKGMYSLCSDSWKA